MKKPFKLVFEESGGYDCMSGAWKIIDADDNEVACIDQAQYGQPLCDYKYLSIEAESIAAKIYAALK